MTIYEYECPFHGRFTVIKPMSEAAREEKCQAYSEPAYGGDLHGVGNIDTTCGMVMTRIYTPSTILPNGSSGDGYFQDSKSGLRSKGKRFREV